MSNQLNHPAGNFCWFELGTNNQDAAKEFYPQLFGWNFNDHPMGEGMGVYTMFTLDDKEVGAAYQLTAEQQGVPPHWMPYVAVQSTDEITAKVAALGGEVMLPGFDVFELGRMAVLKDPTGAVLSVWQPRAHLGADLVGANGAVCWNELATRDAATAGAFYAGLFGWELKASSIPDMAYTEFINAGQTVGGMMTMEGEQWQGIPPHWLTYFAVADCDVTAAKVEGLGGKLAVPPTDIPHVGRFSVLQDPQGAVFAIIKLAPHA